MSPPLFTLFLHLRVGIGDEEAQTQLVLGFSFLHLISGQSKRFSFKFQAC